MEQIQHNDNRKLTPSEEKLAGIADRVEGERRDEWHLDPPESCDYCHRSLSTSTFFIDGKVKDSFQWGNMCPECFFTHGEAVRWGAGQLYQQVEANEWLMVGGFPADEQEPF